MYIQTKEIGPDGLVVERRFTHTLPASRSGEDPVRIGEVRLCGDLNRSLVGGISFKGDIDTVAILSCSRCLESYTLPLEIHFDLLYTKTPEVVTKRENRIAEDSITHVRYDGTRIDLGDLLQEQVYLGLPLKPLCRTDCGGICARCGTNLNVATCECREERAEDPRLLTLKTLL